MAGADAFRSGNQSEQFTPAPANQNIGSPWNWLSTQSALDIGFVMVCFIAVPRTEVKNRNQQKSKKWDYAFDKQDWQNW